MTWERGRGDSKVGSEAWSEADVAQGSGEIDQAGSVGLGCGDHIGFSPVALPSNPE